MTGILIVIGIMALIVIVGAYDSSLKKAQREKDAAERAERTEKRRLALVEKYGEDVGMKLFNQNFFLGMTKEQVTDSKGYPPDIKDKEVLKTKTKETWVWGNKSSGDVFVFENEVLTKFKDR